MPQGCQRPTASDLVGAAIAVVGALVINGFAETARRKTSSCLDQTGPDCEDTFYVRDRYDPGDRFRSGDPKATLLECLSE